MPYLTQRSHGRVSLQRLHALAQLVHYKSDLNYEIHEQS